ncbi:MAG: DUF1134 domain-containing protein, partial [Paucibacter sp.]|nr:DUF1134 domain-containing protein [Roseateles sp.]
MDEHMMDPNRRAQLRRLGGLLGAAASLSTLGAHSALAAPAADDEANSYDEDSILKAATDFFG